MFNEIPASYRGRFQTAQMTFQVVLHGIYSENITGMQLVRAYGGDRQKDRKYASKSRLIVLYLRKNTKRVGSGRKFKYQELEEFLKESISQTVPTNWLQICIDSAGIMREIMSNANATRFMNSDEMLLNY